MAITNLTGQRTEFFSPGDYTDYSKIVITADDNTNYTVLDTYGGAQSDNYCMNANIEWEATGKLASFTVSLSNNDGTFMNLFDGGETIVFYADSTDATTEIFRGKIDDVKYNYSSGRGFTVDINGRQYPELMDKTITGIEGSASLDVGVCGIFYNFYSDISLQYWNGSSWINATYDQYTDTVEWDGATTDFPTETITLTYEHRKGWNVLTDICKSVTLECYLIYDSGWKFRVFNPESITNTNCNIAYGVNLTNVSDYGTENTEIYNRVFVYGATKGDNVVILKSKNDSDSQSNLWIKDKIKNDGSINTMDELDSATDLELSKGLSPTNSGRISAVGIKTLKPGEVINISVPFCGLNTSYVVRKISHNIGNYINTSVEVSKTIANIVDLFVPQVNYEGFLSGFNNPNDMSGSYTKFLEEDTTDLTLYNCHITDAGTLKLDTDATSGYMQMNTYTTDFNITQCELRKYENYYTEDDIYQVSNDGGTTWETYDFGIETTHDFSTVGNQLTVKVILNRDNASEPTPAYKSIAVLYK